MKKAPQEHPPTASEPPPPSVLDPRPAITADELFSLERIPTFHIVLSDGAVASLREKPRSYVRGQLRYGKDTWEPVGIKFKGHLSFEGWDGKPAFKIKFNRFQMRQKFLGLESLTLNNMYSDASMVHEWLSYALFRRMGVPAPRTGYAAVYVNGEFFGLYANIESEDDPFLETRFADPSGSLYEGGSGSDLGTEKDLRKFEQDQGRDRSGEDLIRFGRLARTTTDDFFYGDYAAVDTPRFLAFLAVEALIGHFEGYAKAHNFRLYHDPLLDRWVFLPWGTDQTWFRSMKPFSSHGDLARKCFDESTQCLADYVAIAHRAVEELELMIDEGHLSQVESLIEATAQADPKKRHKNRKMMKSRRSLRRFLKRRPDEFRVALDCLDHGIERDADGDGFGACRQDCDDTNVAIHPGASEVCDGVDNNCSENVDDSPRCPCEMRRIEGKNVHFCRHKMSWKKALRFCQKQSLNLVTVENDAQNQAVWRAARRVKKGRWWIGLNDRDQEGNHQWASGTPASYTAWAPGEPRNRLRSFDCVSMFRSKPQWKERSCNSKLPFVCEGDGPPP